MTTPDSSQTPTVWQGILAAISAVFLAVAGWLWNKSGKEPRPHRIATQADIQRLAGLIEGLQAATEALDRKVDRHNAVMEDHGRRLNRIEVRSEAASA